MAGVTALAQRGIPEAQELLDQYTYRLGSGLANLEQILGLGTYIIHGDAVQGGDDLRRDLQAALVLGAPRRDQDLSVIFAPEPDNMTILGAAGLVLSGEYAPFV